MDDYPYILFEFPLAGIETPLPADDVACPDQCKSIACADDGRAFVAPAEVPMSQCRAVGQGRELDGKGGEPLSC